MNPTFDLVGDLGIYSAYASCPFLVWEDRKPRKKGAPEI